jgi:hypothetical protein
MTLYYCTICALYPCFYNDKLSIESMNDEPSVNSLKSFTSLTSEKETKFESINKIKTNYDDEDELETTSEGLCDFVRELFSLNRQVFNDYQIKVLKKLLFKKSHQQV